MSDVVVFKGNDGKLEGFGDKGRRAYEKFRRTITALEIGATLKFSFKLPRSPKHHRYFFWKLAGLFDRQDRFEDSERLRSWLTVGAGYADFVPGPDGQMVALPQSLAYESMDEAEFVDLAQKINTFLWTSYAREFLWPHLSSAQSYELLDVWNLEHDRK